MTVKPLEPRGCPIPGACACPSDLFDALEALEAANEAVASGRSQSVYVAMLDAGQSTEDLLTLDRAREKARSVLDAWRTPSGRQGY